MILILADDMGYGDLEIFNGGRSRTPNLDKLVEESVYFERAYSGSAVCTPARAALLTGRYPHRTGAITLNMERYPELTRLKLDEITVADLFRKRGYRTGLIGKWHLGDGAAFHPMQRGFDEFQGFKGFDIGPDYFHYQLDINGDYQEFSGEYLTDNLTGRAIDFVTRHQSEPFFLHLAHYAPHRPLSAPPELVDRYLAEGFDTNTATVYAMIEVMDRGIGKLLAALDNLQIRNNTLVIFASDNGPDPVVGERFNHDLRGTKYTVYEGGIRVPLLFNQPGKYVAKTSELLIHFTDILPTLAEICALDIADPELLDGGSFVAGLGEQDSVTFLPAYRFWQWNRGVPYYSHNAAMREGKWKLVRPPVTTQLVFADTATKPRLFDTDADPGETVDLSEQESLRYNIMRVKLEQWSREVEASRLRGE
ncbi:MAG: sulfatase-like hydrolase/transferase [Lewinella sp.]